MKSWHKGSLRGLGRGSRIWASEKLYVLTTKDFSFPLVVLEAINPSRIRNDIRAIKFFPVQLFQREKYTTFPKRPLNLSSWTVAVCVIFLTNEKPLCDLVTNQGVTLPYPLE